MQEFEKDISGIGPVKLYTPNVCLPWIEKQRTGGGDFWDKIIVQEWEPIKDAVNWDKVGAVLDIGAGVVGQNMKKIFSDAVFHDPAKGYNAPESADLAFVCVPTEKLPDGSCDVSIVQDVVRRGKDLFYCIKSTVKPLTTEGLSGEGYEVCFSPEYFGGTIHANSPEHDFVIVGGDCYACDLTVQAYREYCHPSLRVYKTNARTAELVKYMENSFLALKVVFCNEFARIADKIGVDYDVLRELFLADSRSGPGHYICIPGPETPLTAPDEEQDAVKAREKKQARYRRNCGR